MQCQSYFPVYHSHYELNVDANGGSRPMHNGNAAFRSGHYSNYVSSSAVPQGHFGYKELVRQTMLMHEVTFRDQVQELHRLYSRQKDLMGEIKSKELHVNYLDLEVQSANSSSVKFSSGCGQSNVHGLPFLSAQFRGCFTDTNNIQRAVNCIKNQKTPESLAASQDGGTLNNLQVPESKGKKIGGKLLDLELPAEVYIDTDEGDPLEDAQFYGGHTSASLPSTEHNQFVVETDAAAFGANMQLDPISQGGSPGPYLYPGTKHNLADLNEPSTTSHFEKCNRGPGNEETNAEISETNCDSVQSKNASSMEFIDELITKSVDEKAMSSVAQCDQVNIEVHPDLSEKEPTCKLGKSHLVVQALPSFTNQLPSRKRAKLCSTSKGPKKGNLDAGSRGSPSSDTPRSLRSKSQLEESVAHMSSKTSVHLKHAIDLIDLNTSATNNSELTPSDDTSSGKDFTEAVEKRKYRRSHRPDLSKVSSSCKDIVSSKQNSLKSDDSFDGETARKSKRHRLIDINLPCDFTTDEDPLIDDDLVRHDYKNLGETNLNLGTTDDGLEPKAFYLDRKTLEIDLEAPVSPEVEERPPPRSDSEENQPDATLQVFTHEGGGSLAELANVAAETIVSISSSNSRFFSESGYLQKYKASDNGNLEWFAEFVYSLSTDLENDLETLSREDIDDFEAMTLKLTEMKAEKYWCRNNAEISSTTCPTSLAGQTRRGRTRRSKRKDFQREVLPSLASLSRYEVTEDIQIIEGLLEAAGTPWQLMTKRACRMGRKPRVIKQQMTATNAPDLLCGALVSWGKNNQRPRKQRSPASVIMSKWLEFAV